ncbi:hypothetical protein A9Q94_03315 [Rhodobacterales bacterium 56_14_T64]|nr:hypothetical protein A9Q94_03315 [Rhodobacterales bacterium 56_14_T64]
MRFCVASLPPLPWKNGKGTTRELALREDHGRVIWRLSLAEITQDGAFSTFPGMARIHTIVAGQGLLLDSGETTLVAKPHRPLHFDGGLPLTARLLEGACRAFNVIYDPKLVTASAQILTGDQVITSEGQHALFVLRGILDLGPAGTFSSGEGLVSDHVVSGLMADDAQVLQIQFTPV